MGMAIKSISSAFHVSRNTVRKYVRRYQESGLTLEQLMAIREDKLQEMFLDDCNRSRKPSPRMEELEALVPEYVKRLSRKGVTVKSLHDEYLREHPDRHTFAAEPLHVVGNQSLQLIHASRWLTTAILVVEEEFLELFLRHSHQLVQRQTVLLIPAHILAHGVTRDMKST